MAQCDCINPIPAILYPSAMPVPRAHALSTQSPVYTLTLTGVVRGTPLLSQRWYSLEPAVHASAHEYARVMDLRDSVMHHKLDMTGLLGDVFVLIVASSSGFGIRAAPQAWIGLPRYRPVARVEWKGLFEIEAVVRGSLTRLN